MPRIPILADLKDQWTKTFEEGKKNKHVAIRATMEAVRSTPQGVLLGLANHQFNKMMKNPEAQKNMNPQQLKMVQSAAETPIWRGVLGFVALFSTQSAASEVMAHYRPQKDAWNAVVPAACGGFVFGVASPTPGSNPAVMALGFAGFTWLFHKFSPGSMDPAAAKADAEAKYMQSQYMLTNLGLQKYHRNIKNGLLTDDTIMLWNEAALTECRIPPGPRLLILDHLEQVRHDHKIHRGHGKAITA